MLAVLVDRDNLQLAASATALPKQVLAAARRRLPALRTLLVQHPQALDEVEQSLLAR